MAFSDLQLKVASEQAVLGLQKHTGWLKFFATDLKPMNAVHYAGVSVPVYKLSESAEFNAETNNYGTSQDIDGITVTLDKHFVKSVGLTDIMAGSTEINFLRDSSKAIVDVLGHSANKYCFGLINETNVSKEAAMPTTKQAFAGLMKVCDDNGVNPYECTLVLNPESFGALLATLDSNVYGGAEAIRYGICENLYGFRAVVMSSYLPSGVKGAIIPYNTFGIISRLNTPAVNGYVDTFTAETTDGFAVQFRVFENLEKGKAIISGDVLVGAKILQDGIIRLV